jgi:sec-independent protein translocase protein TatC
MESEDKKQGAPTPPEENVSEPGEQPVSPADSPVDDSQSPGEEPSEQPSTTPEAQSAEDERAGDDELYDPYNDYDEDPYGYDGTATEAAAEQQAVAKTETKAEEPPPPAPPSSTGSDEDDDEDDGDDDGMLRMSFMDHLEELRSRILRSLAGIGVAFLASLAFANKLWLVVSEPATAALTNLGIDPPNLVQIKPMETFTTVWVKVPILTAVFLASPWVLLQVWGFIAPGLYKRERRWAVPFVLCTAGLFVTGGMFAYFVAFRFGLTFLLGIGREINITPFVSITEYFDLFVNVTLGVGLVFEIPILIFFLILLRIVTPGFLVRNSRYALLIIVIIAAIVTPTPDVVNLMLFSVPMCLLYFVGIFAGYILNLHRDSEKFPWHVVIIIAVVTLLILSAAVYLAIAHYGFHFQTTWPYFTR